MSGGSVAIQRQLDEHKRQITFQSRVPGLHQERISDAAGRCATGQHHAVGCGRMANGGDNRQQKARGTNNPAGLLL